MTDRRATELSYGYLGETSYDLDENAWRFSREITLESSVQPLQPLQQCTPPSLVAPQDVGMTTHKVRTAQIKWLHKNLPEAGAASATLQYMTKTLSRTGLGTQASTLLAIGKAANLDRVSGARAVEIMAIVHGEAGNFLRLVKPRVEALKWDTSDSAKLRSLNPSSSEECYWLGDGGPIQQITFAADSDGFTSWLAVLKAESTTILRPIYCRDLIPSMISAETGTRYPASRLGANPVLRLGNERTGARPHAHVSFNPWYVRQFAVVDQKGYWSVWDIEGQKRKRSTFEAKPGRSGHIQDDLLSNQSFKSYHGADGWGRVSWAGGFSTLVVCDRRNLAVFDLKAMPKRLYSPEIVHPKSTDWILDMKLSTIDLHHIFILTTTRVFWLQITEAGEDRDKQYASGGASILLSCPHFRNQEDETAKLELFSRNKDCLVLLYSAQSLLVNTYRFSLTVGESIAPICSQGSFMIEINSKDQSSERIQNLCFLPATFMLHNLKPMSGLAKEYTERDVRFYQLFGLSVSCGLYHVLCASKQESESKAEAARSWTILPPTIKESGRGRIKSSLRVDEDQFIVPDSLEEDDDVLDLFILSSDIPHQSKHFAGYPSRAQDSMSSLVDARRLFEISFLGGAYEKLDDCLLPNDPQKMEHYLHNIYVRLDERKKQRQQGLLPFLDLVGHISISEDIDETASAVRGVIENLSSKEEIADSMTVGPLVITPSLLVQPDAFSASSNAMSDLSDVYDNLIGLWVSCLPRNTPGPARLSKEKLVRSVAIELCLSSVAVSMRENYAIRAEPVMSQEGTDFLLPVRPKPDSFEKTDKGIVQTTSSVTISSLPAPAAIPSLPPSGTPSFRESVEDGAVMRLRGYVLSINSQPPLGRSKLGILSHWPSEPGGDPSKYSWEASRKAVAGGDDIDIDEEEALNRRREEDRNRRRTDKLWNKQRVNIIDTASQPIPAVSFGSQSDPAQDILSSQPANTPMSQPDRGAFGSRIGQKRFKKRRTIGF